MYLKIKNKIAHHLLTMNFVKNHTNNQITKAYPSTCEMGSFKKNDVFIVGYPKSGNTWMQNILAGIVYGAQGESVSGRLIQELVPDVHYKSHYQRLAEVCYFKSHLLPQKNYRRVIHIVRDGRDALVSYMHYQQNTSGQKLSYEQLIEIGIGEFGMWGEHSNAWLKNPFGAEILLLRYEDILLDGLSQLKLICAFVGINKKDKELIEILDNNQFEKLKSKEKKFGFGHETWNDEEPFFRNGKIGSYKDEMPKDLLKKFENKNQKYLNLLNYKRM